MPLILILATFAVYRLATDFAWMDGPFNLYARARGYAQVHAPDWIAEGLTCPICIGWYVSLIVTSLLWISGMDSGDAWKFIFYWIGMAGASAFLVRIAPS